MNVGLLLPGLLAAAAVLAGRSDDGARRLARLVARRPAPGRSLVAPLDARAAAAVGGVAVALFVGGPLGVAAGLATGLALPRLLQRLEPASVRRRRELVSRDLPVATDLLAACLAAGAAPDAALAAAGRAVGGPVGEVLLGVTGALRLGSTPAVAWERALTDPELAPLARAVTRAVDGGTPLVVALERCAADLRDRRQGQAEEVAQAVGVRVVAPLGLCFLPAFVLLGVIPTVVGLASGILP